MKKEKKHIGLVLSKPPGYSETFFIEKIKGLKAAGLEPILFVQKGEPDFKLCKVVGAPNFSKSYAVTALNLLLGTIRIISCLGKSRQFIKYKKMEGCSWVDSFKNLYANTHIIQADLDWVHYGFATMAIGREPLAKSIKAKMAVSCRGYDMDVYPLKHNNVYRTLWHYVDKVHVISKYMREKALENGMDSKTNCEIITPAVERMNFEVRKDKTKSTVLKITTIARLHWIKGLMDIVEALAILKNRFMAFEYVIIGEGEEFANIKFAIHQLGLQDKVKLLGKLSHDKTLERLENTDIYIQYSWSEGFCNAVLEAQAMGCLTIVSDGGALPENVIHNQTGWVVPKQNPEELAKTILRVNGLSQEEKNRIRQQAQERVIKNFNLSKQNREFVEFYKS